MARSSTVTVIPATISRYTASPINEKKKRRTAAYARVSTDSEEQQTSYAAQVDYYTAYIKGRDDWEFVEVYTDEGITGTSKPHGEIRAVSLGILYVVGKAVFWEYPRVIRKQAKQQTHEVNFQRMPLIAVLFQGVMQLGHLFGGLDVDLDLIFIGPGGLIACDIGELFDVLMKVFCFKLNLLSCISVVKDDSLKVTDHQKVRHIFTREMKHIFFQLAIGFVEISPPRFEFDCYLLGPVEINIPIMAIIQRDFMLIFAYGKGIFHTKDSQELFFKSLRQRLLTNRLFSPL